MLSYLILCYVILSYVILSYLILMNKSKTCTEINRLVLTYLPDSTFHSILPLDPLPVTSLTVMVMSTSEVQLSWTPDPGSVQNKYRYRYRRLDNSVSWTAAETTENIQVAISSLFPGGEYVFEVKAVSDSSESTRITKTATMCKCIYADMFAAFIKPRLLRRSSVLVRAFPLMPRDEVIRF